MISIWRLQHDPKEFSKCIFLRLLYVFYTPTYLYLSHKKNSETQSGLNSLAFFSILYQIVWAVIYATDIVSPTIFGKLAAVKSYSLLETQRRGTEMRQADLNSVSVCIFVNVWVIFFSTINHNLRVQAGIVLYEFNWIIFCYNVLCTVCTTIRIWKVMI